MKTMPSSCIAHTHALHRMWANSRQRGSVAVMAAIAISTMVILLASIDIGYLFFQKRELQKIADLSALAGAQQLGRSFSLPSDSCVAAFAAARGNANAQAGQSFSGTYTISCGRWDPVAVTTAPYYQAYAGGGTPTGLPAPTAVSVLVSKPFNSFFGAWASRTVSALAIATADSPIAVFSVESRLLRIDGGVVPTVLSNLGVNINGTSLVSYDGVANAKVTTGGLLAALGFNIPLTADVATIKNLISVGTPKCQNGICLLSDLLGEISTIGGQSDLINALGIQSGRIKLLTDSNGSGLLSILDTANGKAALEANIKAPQLLTTAIITANSKNSVDANLGVTIPGVISADTKLGIVEPPSIGIGGVGATAYTSQVRLFSHVKTDDGSLTSELITKILKIDLPLAIDVVNGKGTIKAMCNAKDVNGNDTAIISVAAPLLKICVGNIDSTSAFSTLKACDDANPNPGDKNELLNVLNGALKLSTHFSIDGLPNNVDTIPMIKGQTVTVGNNPLQLGVTLRNVMKAVVATTLGTLLGKGQDGVTNSSLAAQLLANAVGATGTILQTAVNSLNTTVQSLKTFLGNLGPDVTSLLTGSPVSGVATLLNSVGGLLNGLLTGIANLLGNLLGNVLCGLSGNYNQCMLANQLSGSQGSGANAISNVLLTLLGLVEQLLAPILDTLGSVLATQLNNLLGINLGQVDVTLIDLKCGGGANVRLVY